VGFIAGFLSQLRGTEQFSMPTFSIRIHSPAESGLEIGKQYSVQAKWNGAGYDVDQLQWMKGEMAR
jgi:hypothetical protein